ncbi:hypothetical protein FOMPIDRAFT_94217, partial [Fomitopsis schrenkii]
MEIISSPGTIYVLALIALANLTDHLFKLNTGNLVMQIASVLRAPDPKMYCGELIIQTVIPAAAALSSALPLSFETLLSRESLVGIGMEGDSSSLKCTSLEQSDKVFESLKLNQFKPLLQNNDIWRPFSHAVNVQRMKEQPVHLLTSHWLYSIEGGDPQDYPSPISVKEGLDCIQLPDLSNSAGGNEAGAFQVHDVLLITTELNLNLQSNHWVPYPSKGTKLDKWTQQEREKVCKAKAVKSVFELRDELSTMYKSGMHASQDQYIKISLSMTKYIIIDFLPTFNVAQHL